MSYQGEREIRSNRMGGLGIFVRKLRGTATRRGPIHFGFHSHAPCPMPWPSTFHLLRHAVHSVNKSSPQSSFPRISHEINQKSFMEKRRATFFYEVFFFRFYFSCLAHTHHSVRSYAAPMAVRKKVSPFFV